MKNVKFKAVINERALRNFDALSQQDSVDIPDVPVKQVRDPKGKKERDMRKQSKKDRWDD